MKEFRKNQEGLFICEECNKTFNNCQQLSRHIHFKHNGQKQYFDKWIKEEREELCKICNKETKFLGIKWNGYAKCCCRKCEYENRNNSIKIIRREHKNEILEKTKQTNRKKYGVDNVFQSTIIKNTIKQTCKNLYNNENYRNCKKIKQTKKEKYGDENYNNQEKTKQTNIKKYGVEYIFQDKDIKKKSKQTKKEKYGDENYCNKEKAKQTSLKHFGVEYPSQNLDINKKQQKSRFKIYHYKDTDIWYQGSYELDFLDKYLLLFPNITRGPSITYIFKDKNRVYHSDFFIPDLNLVVEIKNSHLAHRDKDEIETKQKATIDNDFNYIMVLNKIYDELNSIIKKNGRHFYMLYL